MLKQVAFANAAAISAIALYLVLWIVYLISPELFKILYNANFFGADIVSLVKIKPDLQTILVPLVGVAAISWIWGYIFVWFYNMWAKK